MPARNMLVGKRHTTTEPLARAPAAAPTRTVVSGRQRFRGRSDDTIRFPERISENSQTIDGRPYVADGNGAFRPIYCRPRHSIDRVTASTASQRRPRHSVDSVTASTASRLRPRHSVDSVTASTASRLRPRLSVAFATSSAVGVVAGAALPLRPHGAVPAPPGNGVHSRCTGRAWRAHTPGHQSDPVTTTSIRCLAPTVGALAPEPAVPGRGLR